MPYGQLEVTVVEAKKLKETDFFDKADPYVSLSLDKQNKQKTRAIQDAGSQATWNEKFIFDVLEGRNELFLEVFDEDVGSDDLIGGVIVPLYQVFQQGYVNEWFHITRPSGKPAGEVHLSMNFKNQGPTSGPPGHTPYPVPDGPGYFSTPNPDDAYRDYTENLSNLGPEGGAIPLGYGSGAPPNIRAPQSTVPPAYPAYPAYPDPSSYGVNMQNQSQTYYQQPTYGAPPPDYKPPSSEQHHKEKEQKQSGDNDWMATAGIAVAAAAGAGALGFLGGKLYNEYEEDKDKHKHEKYKHEKHKEHKHHYNY